MNILLEQNIVNKIFTLLACFSLYLLVHGKFYVDSQSRLMKIFSEEGSRLLV